ncbi:helix-turn-helix domain-containing protein [Chryseobacterium aahli]|uniref:helix-turn-helix transcriptional regulator n=1 Tax=Chryseobacterium aahli TaxID=1278643 RepID=UPI001F60634E|nr:helix-turn-helix transcriptional regulator [Chryseobacterium aahli]MCI3939367.1 helix-turn-helix domain-containing protein [Chryseobacterium aahli]
MQETPINRLKAVLAEKQKTSKWLSNQLNKSETTISRWCRNEIQPSVENMAQIAELLKIDIKELLNSTK